MDLHYHHRSYLQYGKVLSDLHNPVDFNQRPYEAFYAGDFLELALSGGGIPLFNNHLSIY